MSLNIQQQIRDNSRDLSAYLQDLNAFTSDVKAKDEALTRKEVPVTAAPAAPVRGRVAAHRVKSESEVKAANRRADETTGARVSATTPSTTAAATPSTTTTDVVDAASEKALGNACFKRGEYEAAIAHYTASLEREGATCAAHANRAMCAIKLERWSDAAADCDAAIAIDPGYLKAHQRRGVARRALGRFLESTMDFENALRLEPESKILRAEREASKAAHELEANVRITQVRRIVPVRRCERAKAEKAEKEEMAVEATPSPSKLVALESSEGEGERRGGGRDPKTPPEVEREPPSRAEPVLLSTEEDPPPPPRRASPPSASPSASARNKPNPPPPPPPPPRTGAEFETRWRACKSDAAKRSALVASLDVGSAASGVFRLGVAADALPGLVATCARGFADGAVPRGLDVLREIAKTPRFEVAAMLIAGKAKREATEAWDEAAEAARARGDEDASRAVAALRKTYKCG